MARIISLVALLLITGGRPIVLQAQVYSEEAVKAVFLHRFANYVAWPDATRDSPLVIGVLEDEGVATELERLLPEVRIQGQPASLRRIAAARDLEGVHIVYVGGPLSVRSRGLLEGLASKPVLLVTDDPKDFAQGGVINFVRSGRNLRFEVSLPQADARGLRIDSGLLSVASRVIGRPQGFQFPEGITNEAMTRLAVVPRHQNGAAYTGGERAFPSQGAYQT